MIRILEKKVADKIAAGEVIDSPVSVVKELVENSIDSDASDITVEIRDGGKTYIRVSDNGCGIDAVEAELALKRHATSKIISDKDLGDIATLGFRGEALASICAVSRFKLITKTAAADTGRKIAAEGGSILENTATGCPDGTTAVVEDIFFNLPARHKFMATDGGESRKVIDFVSRAALSYPDIRFTMISGNKNVFSTSGRGNILSNIIKIYGADSGRDLLPVERARGNYMIKGFVSGPASSASSRKRQIFCVNGRVISSKTLEQAVERAYKERLQRGRFPLAFIFLSIPPAELDVNIHPAKREIRFDDSAEIEDFVEEAVRAALKLKEAIPQVEETRFAESYAAGENDGYGPQGPTREGREADNKKDAEPGAEIERFGEQVDIKNILSTIRERENSRLAEEEGDIRIPPEPAAPFDFDELVLIGAVFNTYIIASDAANLYMIDQHAAHERVFYEKLMKQYEDDEKPRQSLIVPLNFDLSAEAAAGEEAWSPVLEKMGYEVEFFGGNTYLVRAVPAFMRLHEAEAFLRDLFDEMGGKPDMTSADEVDRIITRSCKSAIKAGDVMTGEEARSLLVQLKACENPFSCPHGRPTFIRMSKREIEKMFKRI